LLQQLVKFYLEYLSLIFFQFPSCLNKKFYFPKSILNITDSEKEIYKQAYSKKLKKRKIKYAAVGTIVTGVAVSLMVRQINSGFNMSGGGGGGKKMPWHGQ